MSKLIELKGTLHLIGTKDGGRQSFILSGYRPSFKIEGKLFSGMIILENQGKMYPGETNEAYVYFIPHKFENKLKQGLNLSFTEGSRPIGDFLITKVNGLVEWDPDSLSKIEMYSLLKKMDEMISSVNPVNPDALVSQLIDEGVKSNFSNKDEVRKILITA